jgi:hypothetical protein
VHTTKDGRRYSYYVSKPEDNAKDPDGKQGRLPARELERHISERMQRFLSDENELAAAIEFGAALDQRTAVLRAARNACDAESEVRWTKFRSVIHQIRVRPQQIDLELSRERLNVLLLGTARTGSLEDDDRPDIIKLELPIRLHRTGHDLRLIINNGPAADESGKQDPALMKWLARGRRWYQQLTSGEIPSLRAIAASEGITERFISRVIAGSLLAPDIVERVVQGRQPITFTVKSIKLRPPTNWEEQRRAFGMMTR